MPSRATEGTWTYVDGTLFIFAPDEEKPGELVVGAMLKNVHWHFRVLYSKIEATGSGTMPRMKSAQEIVWVIGPGAGAIRRAPSVTPSSRIKGGQAMGIDQLPKHVRERVGGPLNMPDDGPKPFWSAPK
jgi:hypothetical protein